jgi:hypothetical protein
MSLTRSARYAVFFALGLLAILWTQAGAAPPPDAAEVLEVKVLEAEVHQGQGESSDVLYRMEVISVLRSASKVQPGETVTVRTSGPSKETLERGWMGTAYVNRDTEASGSGAGHQFVTAAESGSLVVRSPGPPSATFTREAPAKGGQSRQQEDRGETR